MNDGKKFAYFLFLKKSKNGDHAGFDEFLSTMQVWFNQLVHLGYINEMFSCMETALDVFKELRAEILKCTAKILAANGLSFAAHKVYILALKFPPVHLDILEDFEQTCNNCIQRWHFRMLNDYKRNDAFFRAISNAVADGYKDVIDIGSGTGILSIFAAASGATSVFACEASDAMFEISENVIKETNFQDQIHLTNKMSTDLTVGKDMLEKSSLVITEIFDCALFGEGVIPTLKHAWKELLKAPENGGLKPKVIPSRARIFAFLIESTEIRKHSRSLSSVAGFRTEDVLVIGRKDPEDMSEQPYTTENLKYLKCGYKSLSHSAMIMDIDFNDPSELDGLAMKSFMVDLPIVRDGTVDAIAVWFELHLDENIRISTEPESESCWEQAIYHLETEDHEIFDSMLLSRGCSVELKCSCNEQYLQIYVNRINKHEVDSSVITADICNDFNCAKKSNDMEVCSWYHNTATSNMDHDRDDSNENSFTSSTLKSEAATVVLEPSERNINRQSEAIRKSSSNNFSSKNNENYNVQQVSSRCLDNKNFRASKSETKTSPQTQFSTDRRKVARMNDEEYLQCYKSAISLAVQANEMSNHDGKIDVLFYCGKMSLIPLLIKIKDNIRIHVLCDCETQKFLKEVAGSNNIDMQQYEFYEQSLVDVAENGKKFDTVIMEIVDENGLLCQRLFDDIILIRTFLMKENGILIPESFQVNGKVIFSPTIEHENFVTGTEKTMGYEIGKFINEFQAFTTPDISLFTLPLVDITDDFNILDVSLIQGKTEEDVKMLANSKNIQKVVPVLNNGSLSAVAHWFKICLHRDCFIDTAANEKTHWHQTVVMVKESFAVNSGEHLTIDISLNRSHVHLTDICIQNS